MLREERSGLPPWPSAIPPFQEQKWGERVWSMEDIEGWRKWDISRRKNNIPDKQALHSRPCFRF
jgi:hypothetical protein